MREYPKKYVGDGIEASFDGYQIWLRTTRGFSLHEIALPPEVLPSIFSYIGSLGEDVCRHFGMELVKNQSELI